MQKWGWVAAAALTATLGVVPQARAFCGFYVGGSGDALYNNATHVVLMREGQRTVLSMANNYQGPPEDFALVIPVPVVLGKQSVKTLPGELFDRVDQLTAPRLVEYWEQDPCPQEEEVAYASADDKEGGTGTRAKGEEGSMGRPRPVVKVEAKFDVNEYQIVILSASESTGLETWLNDNGYKIPAGAAEVLAPYVQQGSKFFVAKVDAQKVKLKDGMIMLSPLRFHYDSERFDLPIRLGLINAKDAQDLIVNIVARNKRYEVLNYPNVTIPTNIEVTDAVRDDFAGFYATLYDATVAKHPKAVVTEYAWSSASCDPCPTPPLDDQALSLLGADVLPSTAKRYPEDSPNPNMLVTFVDIRPETVKPAQWFKDVRPELERCYDAALIRTPEAKGTVGFTLTFEDREVAGVKREASANGELPEGLTRCIDNRLRAKPWRVSAAGNLGAGPPDELTFSLRFDTVDAAPGRVPPGGFARDYVVTRLHARYAKDTAGEDLVFRQADGIAGGRETGGPGRNEQGAKSASYNTFQARYIIRHLWDGPVECDDPYYGRWGGPPSGEKELTPARDLAFAKRGGLELAKVARSAVPELGIAPTPRALRPGEERPGETRDDDDLTEKLFPLYGLLAGLLAAVAAAFGARRLTEGKR